MARLIPACAGKTRRLWAWRPPSPAHPRACGENVLAASSASSTPGSSPRVRGKPDRLGGRRRRGRLIPARAGKTTAWARGSLAASAHPRACGENPLSSSSFARGSGSSPRVRGKRRPLPHRRRRGRLIPARAGKTSRPRRPPPSRPAHPRACGENSQHEAFMYPRLGSSPRVRGKHPRRPRTGRGRGLIPARAGKTTRRPRGRGCPWAHPHACGENLSRSSLTFVSWGSSPRVRGKPDVGVELAPIRGLIPARAGKTGGFGHGRAPAQAHPRACGENLLAFLEDLDELGSSPRVRGKRVAGCPELGGDRLIPARAGKTATRRS